MVASALISAGGSLLGGLFGKKKSISPGQATEQTIGAQARWSRYYGEKFGFNPLTLLGVSAGQPGVAGDNSSMGNAIADSMMILADSLAKKTDTSSGAAQQVTRLANQNAELKRKLDTQTIRPKVGCIYAQNEAVPSLASALGKSNGRQASGVFPAVRSPDGGRGGSGAVDPLQAVDPGDPRRGVDNTRLQTSVTGSSQSSGFAHAGCAAELRSCPFRK